MPKLTEHEKTILSLFTISRVGNFDAEHVRGADWAKSKGIVMTSLTRVLVITGVVTLVNAQGGVTGQANHLLAAEAGKAPVNHAIGTNASP